MSWDIIVQDLPEGIRSIKEIPDDYEPKDIGLRSEIIEKRNALYEIKAERVFDEAAFYAKVPKEPEAALIHTIGSVVGLSLLTYLHVVVGEMVPKSVALSTADRAVLIVAPLMMVAEAILNIPVRFLNAILFPLNIGVLAPFFIPVIMR